MAEVGAALRDETKPFRSGVTASSDVDPGRDVVLMKDELQDYLKRFRDALLEDLAAAEERIAALEP
jgi:hypothetical protein